MRKALIAPVVLLALNAAPALAQELTAEEDHMLWCGSAFFWLSTNASDTGDEREAEYYDTWSTRMMGEAITMLKADRLDDNAIEHVMDAYDNALVKELGSQDARYDIATCLELVEQLTPRVNEAPPPTTP